MKTPGIAIALVVIIVASVSARLNQDSKGQALSSQISTQPSITPSPTPTSAPISTYTPAPAKPEDSSKKTPTALSNFFYPGAKVLVATETSASLESSEDTEKITDWYKGKIEALGMNVKSFIVTRANDKVLNKLSGADGTREINVEISKEGGNSLVIITILLDNF